MIEVDISKEAVEQLAAEHEDYSSRVLKTPWSNTANTLRALLTRLEAVEKEREIGITEGDIVAHMNVAALRGELLATKAKLAEVEAERDAADELIAATFADLGSNNIRLAETSHRVKTAETALTAARAALVTALAHLDSSLFTNAEHQRAKETLRAALAAQEGEG